MHCKCMPMIILGVFWCVPWAFLIYCITSTFIYQVAFNDATYYYYLRILTELCDKIMNLHEQNEAYIEGHKTEIYDKISDYFMAVTKGMKQINESHISSFESILFGIRVVVLLVLAYYSFVEKDTIIIIVFVVNLYLFYVHLYDQNAIVSKLNETFPRLHERFSEIDIALEVSIVFNHIG